MSPIEKRLRGSINTDAVNGNRDERAICQSQMYEAANEITELRKRITALEAVAEKYQELLYQVACKFPNETRHETALRYLKERESQCAAGYLRGENE